MSTVAGLGEDSVRVVLEPEGADLDVLWDAVCELECAHLIRAGDQRFVFVPHEAAFRLTGKAIFIYALIDPETKDIRYVGKSIRPRARLTNHLNEKSRCYRTHWLQSLRRRGLRPILRLLDILPLSGNWQAVERDWIARAREAWSLVNSTDGGDGVVNLPAEARERMRKTWLGRKHRPETIAKLIEARHRRPAPSEVTRAKMREKMRGRYFSPEHRARISEGTSRFSAEELADIRDALAAGVKVREIAEKYGVHRTTVSKIKMGTYAPVRSGVA